MVQLVPLAKEKPIIILLNFNSTMVQLVQYLAEQYEKLKKKFQFHYGSISSELSVISEIDADRFQFHYGSISSVLQGRCGGGF